MFIIIKVVMGRLMSLPGTTSGNPFEMSGYKGIVTF